VKHTTASRLRDLLSYVAIGLLCVGVVCLLAVYGARKGESNSPVILNWIGLGGVMAIVYIGAIHHSRTLWKNRRFWSGLTLAFLAQVAIGTVVLWSAPRLSVWMWAGLYPINAIALEAFVKRWLLNNSPRRI